MWVVSQSWCWTKRWKDIRQRARFVQRYRGPGDSTALGLRTDLCVPPPPPPRFLSSLSLSSPFPLSSSLLPLSSSFPSSLSSSLLYQWFWSHLQSRYICIEIQKTTKYLHFMRLPQLQARFHSFYHCRAERWGQHAGQLTPEMGSETPLPPTWSLWGRLLVLTFIPAPWLHFFYMLEKLIWRTQGPDWTWRECLSEQRGHWAIGSSPKAAVGGLKSFMCSPVPALTRKRVDGPAILVGFTQIQCRQESYHESLIRTKSHLNYWDSFHLTHSAHTAPDNRDC